MAIKDIIASGIGFSPSIIGYIVTRGLDIGVVTNPWTEATSASTTWSAQSSASDIWTQQTPASTTWT